MDDRITVLLSTDNNYVQHCCVTMTSVMMHNNGVRFIIFTEGLSSENEEMLKSQAILHGGELVIYKIDNESVSSFPMPSFAEQYISIATYYRLFAALLLPNDIDKVIYMDCDMVARKSFTPLWETDIDGYALGAVYQSMGESQTRDKARLLMPESVGYFNAGLLLINLKFWRDYNVTKSLFNFIKENGHLIKQHDQDVLNAVLYDQVKPLSYTWNFLPLFEDISKSQFQEFIHYDEPITDPANVHFVSAPKPWEYGCTHPYKSDYYKVLQLTPFKGHRPKLVLKNYCKYVVRNRIIIFLSKIDIFNLRKKLNLRKHIKA